VSAAARSPRPAPRPAAGPVAEAPAAPRAVARRTPRADGDEASSQSIATVERAADVLVLFGKVAEPDLGVTEIANELALSKAAVHRILTSLRSRALVELDEETRRYRLGPAALALGLTYLDRVDVRGLARPELVALSAATDETATLSLRTGNTRMYVDEVVPNREVRMSVTLGVPYPLHAGGSSKAFLAFLGEDEIERYLARPLQALTERTVVDPEALRAELRHIREVGYAMSLGERKPGAASVAAPVFDHHGEPAAVVSVCGPLERFREEADACAELLLQSTARLSVRLGWIPREGASSSTAT
jgi:DNA-binding IclR family transcriptional regulator